MQFESSSFLGRLVLWIFLFLLSFGIISFNFDLSLYLKTDFWITTMVVVTLSAPILGVVVCWRNSGPKNQGFFSKLKSLFTKGFWFVFLSAILLFVGLFHNEFYKHEFTRRSIVFQLKIYRV